MEHALRWINVDQSADKQREIARKAGAVAREETVLAEEATEPQRLARGEATERAIEAQRARRSACSAASRGRGASASAWLDLETRQQFGNLLWQRAHEALAMGSLDQALAMLVEASAFGAISDADRPTLGWLAEDFGRQLVRLPTATANTEMARFSDDGSRLRTCGRDRNARE